MREFFHQHRTLLPFYFVVTLILLWLLFVYRGSWQELWITNDQKGYRLFESAKYLEATQAFEDPLFKGAAYYKAGEFKKAQAIYLSDSSKQSKYNLGNCYIMQGKYQEAIEAYEIALKIDPGFTLARENIQLAKARQATLQIENDGKQGVGMLGADEIVYDNKEGKGEDVTDEGGQANSEKNGAHWLDRIQTGPQEFLKNKFSYQYRIQKDEHE